MKSYAELIKAILAVLAIFALFLAIRWVYQTWEANKTLSAQVEQQSRTSTATSTITGDVASAIEGKQVVEVRIAQDRASFNESYQELRNENQTVREYADGAVPVELRDLARARRVSRDGLGGDQAGSRSVDDAAPRGR